MSDQAIEPDGPLFYQRLAEFSASSEGIMNRQMVVEMVGEIKSEITVLEALIETLPEGSMRTDIIRQTKRLHLKLQRFGTGLGEFFGDDEILKMTGGEDKNLEAAVAG
jgi:hypothetical protein